MLLLCGAVLLYLRRRASGRSKRRFAALLVDSFGLALVSLAALSLGGIRPWPGIGVVQVVTSLAMGLAPVVFLIGLLDMRLARTDVGGLLVELDRDPTLDLQAPLARALHDPSLELAYWLPEQDTWADQDGRPIVLPSADQRRSIRLIYRNHEPIAALFFDPALEDEEELLNAVSAAAGIALENGRLRAELRAKLQELQSSRVRALEAGRRERQRLERNLHDGAQQRLVGISIELGSLENRMTADPQLKQRLARTREEVSASLDQLRDIARGIYPAVLSGHGLAVALESLAAGAAVPVRPSSRPHRAASRAGRGRRVLHRQRGSGQHRETRAGQHRDGPRRPRCRPLGRRSRRRRDRRRQHLRRVRPARTPRPGRGARRTRC